MRELLVHLRKDLRLIAADSLVVILLVVLALISVLFAFLATSNYYSGLYGDPYIVGDISVDGDRRQALFQYWNSLLLLFPLIMLVVASLTLTSEKESGMTKFILSYRASKPLAFLSKFIVLVILVFVASLVSALAFLVVFALLGVTGFAIELVLASVLFPFLVLLAYCALGLLISTLSKRRALVVVLAVLLFMGGAFVNSYVQYEAQNDVYQRHPYASGNWTQFVSFGYLVVIYASYPITMMEGERQALGLPNQYQDPFLNVEGNVIAGISLTLAFLGLGYLSFSRERSEGSTLGKGLDWVKSISIRRTK